MSKPLSFLAGCRTIGAFILTAGILTPRFAMAQPGAIDLTFAPISQPVNGLLAQPDGKILVNFAQTGFTRLSRDGKPDPAWQPGVPIGNAIYSAAIQPDGKVLVGGDFLQIQGVPRPCLARFNADCTIDTNFVPQLIATTNPPPPSPPAPPDTGPTNYIGVIVPQSDGKLLVGGFKNILDTNSQVLPKLIRLNQDGSIDGSFAKFRITNNFKQVIQLADGRLLVLGDTWVSSSEIDSWLLRLNPDGTIDSNFTPPTMLGWINAVCEQNGKILVAGYFYRVNGLSQNSVARLNSNGSLDTDFHGTVWPDMVGVACAVSQSDGKVILGGRFTVPGVTNRNLVRLNTDGSLDTTYAATGASSYVFGVAFQPDGKLLVGGEFQAINGLPIANLARLQGDSDAGPGNFVFDSAQHEVYENAGVINLTVRRVWGLQGTVTVNYQTQDGTAKAGIRYQPQSGTVVFGDGETTKTITINILEDSEIQDLESFQVVLSDPTGGASLGNPAAAIISVLDDDGPASLDPAFSLPQGGFDSGIKCIVTQSDGKILVGGPFQQAGTFGRKGVARLNADGSTDATFNPGTGLVCPTVGQAWLTVLKEQPDSKILIAGVFTQVNGTNRNYLARLNNDGSLDTTFDDGLGPNDGQGLIGDIRGLGILTNGQIIVGGGFNTYNGSSRYGLARLQSNGAVDPSYHPAGAEDVQPFGLQADGKVVFSGTWNNMAARVNADGTIDNAAFAVANNSIRQIESLPNGNTIVAGSFTAMNSVTRRCIARLLPGGSVDPQFNADLNVFWNAPYPPYIYKFAVQPDGKILIAIKSYAAPPGNYVARLNTDGTLDTTFEPPLFSIPFGDNDTIDALAVQSDGAILVGGQFQTVNSLPRPYLVRLKGGQNPGTRSLLIKSLAVATNQSRLVLSVSPGKPFVLQYSTNLLSWISLSTNLVPVSTFTIIDNQPANAYRRYYRIMQTSL